MNTNRNFMFFDSKMKKNKKPTKASNHSRSLSAKSDFNKNTARIKPQMLPLTRKQKQIRQAIEYRYRKSKMREYVFDQNQKKRTRKLQHSRSSQMEQYRHLKSTKITNLKQYHLKQQQYKQQKQQQALKRSFKNRLKIRTDSSVVIKTQGSEKSMEGLKLFRPYLQPNNYINKGNKTPTKKEDWKFISVQTKNQNDKFRSQSQKGDIKIKSHRTLTIQQKSKTKIKTMEQNKWIPKLKDLAKLHQKYKF